MLGIDFDARRVAFANYDDNLELSNLSSDRIRISSRQKHRSESCHLHRFRFDCTDYGLNIRFAKRNSWHKKFDCITRQHVRRPAWCGSLIQTYFITDRIENWKPLAENIEMKFDSKCWIQNVLTRCLWISASAKINTSCCKYHNITYKISDSPLIILHNQQAAGIYLRMSQQNLYTWAKTRTRMNEQYFFVNKDFRCTFFFKIQSIYLMYYFFEYDHVK